MKLYKTNEDKTETEVFYDNNSTAKSNYTD